MAIVRKSLSEIMAGESKTDWAKVDATTEDEIRRHMAEDGEDPNEELRVEDIISPQVIRKRLNMTQEQFADAVIAHPWSGCNEGGAGAAGTEGMESPDATQGSGGDDGEHGGVDRGTPGGADAVGDFAEDHGGPERSLGQVVGRRHVAAGDEHEQLVLGSGDAVAQFAPGRGG